MLSSSYNLQPRMIYCQNCSQGLQILLKIWHHFAYCTLNHVLCSSPPHIYSHTIYSHHNYTVFISMFWISYWCLKHISILLQFSERILALEFVGIVVFTMAVIKSSVFLDTILYSALNVNQHLWGTCRLLPASFWLLPVLLVLRPWW
jgi:hypothetical protein